MKKDSVVGLQDKQWKDEQSQLIKDAVTSGYSSVHVLNALNELKLYDWNGLQALRFRFVTSPELQSKRIESPAEEDEHSRINDYSVYQFNFVQKSWVERPAGTYPVWVLDFLKLSAFEEVKFIEMQRGKERFQIHLKRVTLNLSVIK